MINTRHHAHASTSSRLALALLALLTMAATYGVSRAQAQTSGSKPTLISTQCKAGTLTQCGEEPARVECGRTWKLDLGWINKDLGVDIGTLTCVQIGKVTLYKDYYLGSVPGGACSINTSTGLSTLWTPTSPDEPAPEESGTC